MSPFGEDAERYLVFQYIDRLVNRFLILLYRLIAITLTHDRHDFHEGKYLGQYGKLEDIGT